MASITVYKHIDIDVELDEIDTDDLAEELIKRTGYTKALDKALDKSCDDYDDYDKIKELVDAFRLKKPVENIIASIAYDRYGLVC